MIEAAVAARHESLAILGVTVLTSIDQATLRETGVETELAQHVLRLAQLGVKAGINGLVASPHEVKVLRATLPPNLKLVIPGIRPSWTVASDQKRVMTPREAFQAGADYLVIGRPITGQRDPAEAVARIFEEFAG